TSDAIKGMLAKPENREEVVAKLFKSVGGKLIGWYLTFGHHDWLAIGEFPNEKAAASAVLAAAAGGSLCSLRCSATRPDFPAASAVMAQDDVFLPTRIAGRRYRCCWETPGHVLEDCRQWMGMMSPERERQSMGRAGDMKTVLQGGLATRLRGVPKPDGC